MKAFCCGFGGQDNGPGDRFPDERVDVMPFDGIVLRPFQDGLAGELGAVVADDPLGLAVEPHQRVQLPCDAVARDAGVGDQAKVLAAAVIVHGQGEPLFAIGSRTMASEPARGAESVVDRAMGTPLVRVTMARVHRPALVRTQGLWHRRSAAASALAAAPPADPEIRTPALEVARGLIEQVTVRIDSVGDVTLDLEGALAAMLDLAQPGAVRGLSSGSVKVVSGACNRLNLLCDAAA